MKRISDTQEDNLKEFKLAADKYRKELKLYLDQQVLMGKISQSDADGRLGVFESNIQKEIQVSKNGFETMLQATNDYYDALNALIDEKQSSGSRDGGESVNHIRNLFGLSNTALEDVKHSIELFKTTYSGINSFLQSEYERQLTIEQNKTNAMNEELNNRLLNENLSKEERKKIQNQIWRNDENLRKRQEVIAKKKFKAEKAFNLSMAFVNTYMAANQVLSDPSLTGRPWVRIPMAIATISAGLLNVAAIARQKFQSSSAATPINVGSGGGSGLGQGDRDFNFNLVGANQGNQILDAIQSGFDTPIKAYVVSRDMTTQQELDANIQGAAGF